VRLGYGSEPAAFGRRCAAVLMDGVCLALGLWLLDALLRALLRTPPGARTGLLAEPAVVPVVGFIVILALPAFWVLLGATPGKLLLGCRVVDARGGARPRWWQAWLRLFGYALSAAPLGLGFLWALWDRHGQGWHDKLARTRVVIEDESRAPLEALEEALR